MSPKVAVHTHGLSKMMPANPSGGLRGAAEGQAQRYSPEDPSTLEQIRNLKHGCCIVMLRYSTL